MEELDVSGLNPRRKKLARINELFRARSSFMPHWREISQFQQPRLGRFLVSDINDGKKLYNNILDSTAVRASRTLAAGLMSGDTSPARPWFRTRLRDEELMEYTPVKQFLHDTDRLLLAVFAASNTYRALHSCYEELGLFGTWADFVMPDFKNVIHHTPMTIGEYGISTNFKGEVDTMGREFKMTVIQCVQQFGYARCSMHIRNLYDGGKYGVQVTVMHLVEPRQGGRRDARNARALPWSSCYFEPGRDDWDQYLSESGFKDFPVLAPRWTVRSNDVYGHSPGMEALGDVKQLQQQQLRKGQAIDYQTMPPLQVPTRYREESMDARLPGGVFFHDATGPGQGIRTAFEVQLDLGGLLEDIRDVRERINAAYFVDLFMMMANDNRSGVTATEVAERHEEKLLMLGPVLERLHNELLNPLINITFDRCADAGILPPIPPELEGMDIEVEFVSVLSQAQRAVSAAGSDRLLGAVANLMTLSPTVADKIDADQMVDDYADMFGVNPRTVRSDKQVEEMRAAREQQQATMQAAAMTPAAVDTLKTAGEVNTEGVTDVMDMFSGYSTGQ